MFKPDSKMASIKVLLYTSKILKNGEHPIMIRLIKDRKMKYISVGHNCSLDLWDEKKDRPKRKHPNYRELEINIELKLGEAKKLLLNLENEQQDFTINDFEKKYRNQHKSTSFYIYLDELIENLKKTNRVSYANSHKDLERLMRKFQVQDFGFAQINVPFLRKLEQFMREKGMKENTLGVYFRTLRATYKKAIADGYVKKENYPFDEFKVSKLKSSTSKRAIRKEEVQKIANLVLEEGTRLFDSRNFFLFSFYCAGMNFIDVSMLQWQNITPTFSLEYERSKTGHKFNIKLLPPAVTILEYYRPYRSNNYIFPYLDKTKHTTPLSIDNRLNKCIQQVNQDLKELAKRAGIDTKLTTYVARHTFATTLKRQGVSTSMISELMGHQNESITQTYLDAFDNQELYEATLNLL